MSNHSEGLDITGKLVIRKNGKVVREVKNLVVDDGKGYVADRMKTNSTVMNAMAVGTSNQAAAADDSALVGTELGRVTGPTNFTTSVSTENKTVTYTGNFGSGVGTGSIQEAGIFNHATTGGTMLCRTTFAVVTKGASDTLSIDWVITIS